MSKRSKEERRTVRGTTTFGFRCPVCQRVGDPEKMVQDSRWADLVHAECIEKLDRWPNRATRPTGAAGTDDGWAHQH